MLTALLTVILASCGQQLPDDPIDAVPEGVRRVAVLNLDKIAAANGAQQLVTESGITSEAQEALSLFIPQPLLTHLSSILGNGVNTSCAVLFKDAEGRNGMILKITDHDTLTLKLNTLTSGKTEINGFATYLINDSYIGVSDNLCVVAGDKYTIKSIGSHNDHAVITAMVGVSQFLHEGDNPVKLAIAAEDIFGEQMKDQWLCSYIRFSDNAITANVTSIYPDGKSGKIGQQLAGEIDPDVVQFIPSGSNLIVATGLQPDHNKLFGIEDFAKGILPTDRVLSPNGTTLWYARPAGTINHGNIFSPRAWNIAGIMKMDQTEADSTISALKSANTDRFSFDPESGSYFTQTDPQISFGYNTGYFTQAINGIATYGNSNPYTQDFNAARLVAILDIPTDSQLVDALDLPCGVTVTLKGNTDNIHLRISFHGNTQPVLATLGEIPMLAAAITYITGL